MKEIVTFLAFDGNCREAMEFYKKCFGAELFLLPYAEAPFDLRQEAKAVKDRIMHATLSNGFPLLMGADIIPGAPFLHGNNFSVMIECESLPEMENLFAALGQNGEVTMPLQDTFWGARFGTLTDRFGIRWSFNLALPK